MRRSASREMAERVRASEVPLGQVTSLLADHGLSNFGTTTEKQERLATFMEHHADQVTHAIIY